MTSSWRGCSGEGGHAAWCCIHPSLQHCVDVSEPTAKRGHISDAMICHALMPLTAPDLSALARCVVPLAIVLCAGCSIGHGAMLTATCV